MDHAATIARQREFFLTGATRSREFRQQNLRALRNALVASETALLDALHADLRKPAAEAYAAEIGMVLGEIRHALCHLDVWMKPERRRAPWLAWPARASLLPEPLGVALIIGPWNYPLQLLLSPLVAAIAAGNCAVLKPSEHAPHTSRVVAEMIAAAFPEDFLTVVEGGRETAEALLGEKFDTIFFTGGTRAGQAVMAAAARHLTPVTLELGGKCPCIVCADAPLETAARRIAWGKFMNAGQTCVAPDHVLVDQRVAAPFLDALKEAILEFYGPDPQRSPDYGRIVNLSHHDRLVRLLGDGKIVTGGGHDAADLYIAPTVLTDLPPDSGAMAEEIFGPILPVLEFTVLDDLLADLRRRPTPLALYLFTRDRCVQQHVIAETRSGGVCINDTVSQILGNDLPFGGLGESGMGAYRGKAGFDAFSHRRAVLRRALRPDPDFRYPPQKTPLSTLKRVLRLFGAG
jgi:aldehyde dehydrogenase (NAD+)